MNLFFPFQSLLLLYFPVLFSFWIPQNLELHVGIVWSSTTALRPQVQLFRGECCVGVILGRLKT